MGLVSKGWTPTSRNLKTVTNLWETQEYDGVSGQMYFGATKQIEGWFSTGLWIQEKNFTMF